MSTPTDEKTDELAQELDESGVCPAVMASIGSVALVLYYYYVRDEKQLGQFVGL